MRTHHFHPIRPAQDALHPLVYKTMVGLTLWLVFSVWVLFNRGAYVGLNLLIVTVFFMIAMAIPVALWLTWRRNVPADEQGGTDERFRDWSAHEFATWTGGVSGKEAAMQILLPIAAVCIGMTIFGLVFAFAVPNVG